MSNTSNEANTNNDIEEEEESFSESINQDEQENTNSNLVYSNKFTSNQKPIFYQQCQNIIDQLMKSEKCAFFFFRPVDQERDKAPGYYDFILHPISIFDVQQKIDTDQYNNPDEFIKDMRLIWSNAKTYNAPSHLVYKEAEALSNKFEILAATLPHIIDDSSLNNGFQREVELRFARYRLMKQTHL